MSAVKSVGLPESSYSSFLGEKDKFLEAEKSLLYKAKSEDDDFTPEKAREYMGYINGLWEFKAMLKF